MKYVACDQGSFHSNAGCSNPTNEIESIPGITKISDCKDLCIADPKCVQILTSGLTGVAAYCYLLLAQCKITVAQGGIYLFNCN